MVIEKNPLGNETRRKILRILVGNGRASLVEIARQLGISHVAVNKHIRQLVDKSIIRIQANVNPKKLRLYLVLALLEVDEETLKEVTSRFEECPRIIFMATMAGGYNVVALMIAENEGVLKCISTVCAIRILRGIRRSEVYIIADLIKPEYLPIKLPFPRNRDKPPCGRECSVCKMYVVEKKCPGCPATKHYRGLL